MPSGESREKNSHEIESLTVAEAARTLGISSSAVRGRIQRGQLQGYKEAGQWRVVLDSPDPAPNGQAVEPARSGLAPAGRSPAEVDEAARQQLEAIRDEWLQPFVDQLTEQAERIGYLERERDELRRRIDDLESRPTRLPRPGEEVDEEHQPPRLPRPIMQWRLAIVIVAWALWMALVIWLWWAFIW